MLVSRDVHEEASYIHIVDRMLESPTIQPIVPQLEKLGRLVRVNALALKELWIGLASGDASVNKIFAVSLGYVLVGTGVAIYLNVLSVGNVRSASRAFRNTVRQQIFVLKV